MERPTVPFRHPSRDQDLADMRSSWLIPGILPAAGLVILASPPKSGKTCFATALSYAVARGRPILEREPRQATVLWCSYEESVYERLPLHKDLTPEDPFYVAYREVLPPIDSRAGLELLEETVIKYQARLLVIDPLHAAVVRTNLSENTGARRIMQRLKDMSYLLNCTVLVLHHVTKSGTRGVTPERFADSSQIIATASAHLFLEAEKKGGHRTLTLHGEGRYPVPDSRTTFTATGLLDFQLTRTQSDFKPRTSDHRVLETLAKLKEATANLLAEETGMPAGSIRNTLTRLTKTGMVALANGSARPSRYVLPTKA